MPKLTHLLPIAIVSLALAGCGHSGSDGTTEYIPVKIESDGGWGLLGADGEMLFTNEFKQPISDAVDGVFLTQENDLAAIYKAETTPRLLGEWDNLNAVGHPAEGRMVISNSDNVIAVITTDGEKLFELPGKIPVAHAGYSDGMLGVCDSNGKWGFIDKDGTQSIPFRFDAVTKFSEGRAVVADLTDDKISMSIIDKSGERVAHVSDNVRLAMGNPHFINGRIQAMDNEKRAGFLTADGEFVKCPARVSAVYFLGKDKYIYRTSDQKFGSMDFEGEIIVQPRYDELYFVPGSDNYLAKLNKSYSLLDKNGDKLMEFPEYKNMGYGLPLFPLIATAGTRYEVLKSDGKPMSKETFADLGMKGVKFSNSYVSRSPKCRLLESSLNDVVDYVFCGLDPQEAKDCMEYYMQSVRHVLHSANKMEQNASGRDSVNDTVTPNVNANVENGVNSQFPAAGAPGSIDANPFSTFAIYELDESTVRQYSRDDLRLIRNAIFAMHGHIFRSQDLRDYFATYSWYRPVGDASAKLSAVERKNIALIQKYE